MCDAWNALVPELPFDSCWFEYERQIPPDDGEETFCDLFPWLFGALVTKETKAISGDESTRLLLFSSHGNQAPTIHGCVLRAPVKKTMHLSDFEIFRLSEKDFGDIFKNRAIDWKVPLLEEYQDYFRLHINPILLAIGLCQCKNVKQIDQVADISALGKKWSKRNGNPKFTYKVLQIGDMKHRSSSSSDSPSGETCTPKALHIVRGHFATYTAEKPLFGHIVGTVWKPAHARGDIKAGAVVKDYSFKPEFVAEHADKIASNSPVGVQV